jgi:hypothetical protein
MGIKLPEGMPNMGDWYPKEVKAKLSKGIELIKKDSELAKKQLRLTHDLHTKNETKCKTGYL